VIPRELEAKVLRLYFAEKWRVGTIATQLRVHHEVVERVIRRVEEPKARQVRATMVDPYLPFIQATLKEYPTLPASRLYEMCRQRGYPGSSSHFRRLIARHRPRPPAEAYLRLKTLPGEQAQVDWGHFGKIEIGRAKRPLLAFVIVLAWSRAIFLRFFLGQCTENFLRGHEAALAHWGGCPRVILYDNLKSAVLERVGDAIRFNPTLVGFAAHYRFEPRPVAPGRGNEKPRVERAIRYIRGNFFMARRWRDLDDLNHQALAWCDGTALDRAWPEDNGRTVRDALEEERGKLLELPANPFPTDERREVSVRKTPYVRFDGNDYSVPHDCVRQTLVVVASVDTVRILKGEKAVATHARSFDKGQQVEDPSHVADLVEWKKKARKQRSVDRLAHAAPSSRELLVRVAKRGSRLGHVTRQLLHLLDAYGAERLEAAIVEALQRGVPHPHAVRQILERNREAEGKPPVTPIPLPDNPKVRGLAVRPHSLDGYDALTNKNNDQEGGDHDPDDQFAAAV
jgi:transposase